MPRSAVIFDLGGVVIDSPLHAIAAYERDLGIPDGFVNGVVVETGAGGAWSRLERGEVAMNAFFRDFEAECAAAGHRISAPEMMRRIGECGPRPEMLRAITRLRGSGWQVAALTNNWAEEGERGTHELAASFDVFVESAVEGLRKPDPRIYALVCDRLGVVAEAAIFLDDIGRNLKTARELGMHTIKVESAPQALRELSDATGLHFD